MVFDPYSWPLAELAEALARASQKLWSLGSMNDSRLDAISPLDGRYSDEVRELAAYVSEGALTKYRIIVEAAWLLHLASAKVAILVLGDSEKKFLESLVAGSVTASAIMEVKNLEKTTNHDVKAVEYWLQERLKSLGGSVSVRSHVHFACTSEDINNTAYALMLRDVMEHVISPSMGSLNAAVHEMIRSSANVPMISRTHGQPASPTTMGKELAVFSYRLERQTQRLKNQPILAKFNGAVGNYNAHLVACPSLDWQSISKDFVENRLRLAWNPMTTQIESHDSMVEMFDTVRLVNSILIDFSRDMWGYISLGYLVQKTIASEVGSSTMPHKVNPIYFENAEGNLGVSNSLLAHFAEKLPISRWQRDLSDSTVLRTWGSALGHALLAYKNLTRGMARVSLNPVRMLQDLENSWELLAEPVQTVMRRYGVVDAYDRLKLATRGSAGVTRDMIYAAIDGCPEIPDADKTRLKSLTPVSYVGLASKLAMESLEP